MPPPIVNGLVGFTRIVVQTFAASGTYTPTPRMVQAFLQVQAGGGGGGGVAASGAGAQNGSGGGGGGEYSEAWVTATQVGASQVVTVGAAGTNGAAGDNDGVAGGNSSVGTLCTAVGGGLGGKGSNPQPGVGGSGGTGSVRVGGDGDAGITATITTAQERTAHGGSSMWGNGGRAKGTGTAGANATGFGGGGPGTGDSNAGGALAGGLGTIGFIKVTEFCI